MGLGNDGVRRKRLAPPGADDRGEHLADRIEELIRECEEDGRDFVAYFLEMAKQELRPDLDA